MNTHEQNSRLSRLLGPRDDEVGCEECFEALDEFVELELAGADADARLPGLRPHLDGCPACHGEYAALRALVLAENPGPRT